MEQDLAKVLEITSGVGEELIRCGAEISRVEETMKRIAGHYGATKRQIFIISNGVFVNLEMGGEQRYVSIETIPKVSVNLGKLCDLNDLSRTIEKENLEVDAALARLEAIKNPPKVNTAVRIAASGIGAAAFCHIFGGGAGECFGALLMGLLVWAFFTAVERFSLPKVLLNLGGSILVTAGCVALYRLGLVNSLDRVVIGSIIPMIPGVDFINGVRDLADGNYISGPIRLLDALVTFVCIAAGVYIALHLGGKF